MAKRAKRGFATVVKEKSGRYSVRYTTADGRRTSAGQTFAHKADAEAWAATKRRERDKPAKAQHRTMFAEYAQNWLEHRHVHGRPLKPRTVEHYAKILDGHLLPVFGRRQLAAITAQDVRDWHAHTLISAPTLRAHAYGLLHAIFASAVNDDLIDANPCRIRGAGGASRTKRTVIATSEQLTAITDAMPGQLKLMVLLGCWCALRFGECVELRRSDIDLDGGVVRVRRAAVRVKGTYEISDPKSFAGSRDVYVPGNLIPVIEQHLSEHVAAGQDALLFPNATGGHLQPATFNRHWYRARAAAGRDDLRFHDLRHTGATMAAQTGATLKELMDRLGHSTPTAALRYQHATEARGRELADKLSKMMNAT
jgi:integrase